MDVLGELLVTLNQCWIEEDAHRIHSILSCLPKTSRFNLAVEFLTKTEKKGVGPLSCYTIEPIIKEFFGMLTT